jgi:uncharacterized protein (UPF0335 family)
MIAPAILKSAVDRIERLHERRKELADEVRDIYVEMRSQGFDTKVLKIVIQRRAKDPSELSEEEALVQVYEAALGTPVATRAGAIDDREAA